MTWRSRRAVVPVAVLLCLLASCTDADPGAPGDTADAGSSGTPTATAMSLAPDCLAPPTRQPKPSVDDLNRLVASIDLPGWQAGDIGASGQLRDGRLVWLFGDTVRRPSLDPVVVANSMLVSSGKCVAQVLGPDKGPVIPDVSAHVVRWPMSVAVGRQDAHDVIIVLCSRIDRGNSGSFGFTFLGTSAAVFTVAEGAAPQLDKIVDLTPDSRDEQQVNWGAAADVHRGWVYVYGTRLTGKRGDFGRELYLARAPAADPGSRRQWQFWGGGSWQSEVTRAAAVLGSQGGVSQTLSVDSIGGEFVAVSKRDGDVGDYVYTWTAPRPWGPWTPRQQLRAPAGFDTGDLQYAPLAHPEIPLVSGKLLVSISRNTTDLGRLVKDPQVGRPLFVEAGD